MGRARWALCAALGVVLCAGSAYAQPRVIHQEGLLTDDSGQPLEGEQTLRFELYRTLRGGAPLWFEEQRVDLFDGYYNALLGEGRAFPAELFDGDLYLAMNVGGVDLNPRVRLVSVPFAMRASVAENVTGDITPRTVSVGGGVVIDENGRWLGDPAGIAGANCYDAVGDRNGDGEVNTLDCVGAAGNAGDNADPAEVVPLLVQALADNPDVLPFVRSDADDTKAGALTVQGIVQVDLPAASASIRMDNTDMVQVNRIAFNDPGVNEGLEWAGSGARIFVSPLAGGNGDGPLRIINDDDGISLESDTRVSGGVQASGVVSGEALWSGGQQVVDSNGRWTGSSVGLDADTLDGFDSSDFLRAGDLDDLDLGGGNIANVSVITPGGDAATVAWTRSTEAEWRRGLADGVDLGGFSGSIRLNGDGGQSRVVGEVGTLTLSDSWRRVNLGRSYDDPVVIASATTQNEQDGVMVRVRDVRGDSFEIRIDEWDCHRGGHGNESVSYIVMERGHWEIEDGFEIEAGIVRTNQAGPADEFERSFFGPAFPEPPVLASILNSDNGGDAAGTWHHNITADRFDISMLEDERDDTHTTENLGYMAVRPGTGVHNGSRWAAGRTGREVDENWHQIDFAESFPNQPAVLASLNTVYGGDSSQVRIAGIDRDDFSVRVQESCAMDGPHTTEVVGWMAFEPGMTFGLGLGGGFVGEGQHTSDIADFGTRSTFGDFSIDTTLNGQQVGIIVQVSDDEFANVLAQVSITPGEGRGVYQQTRNLPPARYMRVITILRTADRAVTPEVHSYGLQVTLARTIDFSGANVVNIGKINANLFDPVYRIDEELFATYLPENPEPLVELRGRGKLENGEATIPLKSAKRGSKQWLFGLAAEDIHATVTPAGPAALYVERVDEEALVVRSFSGATDVEFFYELTGHRVDVPQKAHTGYRGNPNEVTTAIDPIKRKIWYRGADE